jgi:two-component system chemotaxis response regulator CheV
MFGNSTSKVKSGKLELLVFELMSGQKFGINVFKVKEILKCPKIAMIPKAHSSVKGLITVRGTNLVVLDLSKAIGGKPMDDINEKFVVVTEYNKSTMAFLVDKVDKIIQVEWENIKEPSAGLGSNYLTAIAKTQNDMVQILDIEKVLYEITPPKYEIDPYILEMAPKLKSNQYVMVVDDSRVARKQITICLSAMNIPFKLFENGRIAYEYLESIESDILNKDVALIISDIEMPEMDGYTLSRKVKEDVKYNKIRLILHTSISGIFNKELVESVGADDFVCKFNANELSESIIRNLQTN